VESGIIIRKSLDIANLSRFRCRNKVYEYTALGRVRRSIISSQLYRWSDVTTLWLPSSSCRVMLYITVWICCVVI